VPLWVGSPRRLAISISIDYYRRKSVATANDSNRPKKKNVYNVANKGVLDNHRGCLGCLVVLLLEQLGSQLKSV